MMKLDIAQYINQDRLIETFIELIRINSPSFNEREIGDFLNKRLEYTGCTVEFQEYDKSFNIIAFKKGTISNIPPLLLSGHMDTIEPTEGITFSIEDGVIRTTGNTVLGADDKSALAQILEVLAVINEKEIPHGDLEIVFTSAEENGLFGAKNLDFTRLRSKHALVLDSGGGVGNIVIAAPTHHTYEMKITGKAAHAGIEPEKGISAIRVAARIISEVSDGRINAGTTANIGVIKGGTATNVVPKEVTIKGELRSQNEGDLEKTKKALFNTAETVAKQNGAQLEIASREEYKAFRIDENDSFLRFLDGIYKECGLEPVHTTTGGGSDANIFNQNGIMAINISTGMQKVHSTEEHIYIKDLYNGSVVVLSAIASLPQIP